MALPAESNFSDDPDKGVALAVICPICAGKMDTVYHRHHQRVVVCLDCQSGLTIPTTAWDVARIKRDAKRSA
jgi:ribosomal protein S27E